MDIVKHDFKLDGKEEMIKMVELNDTRVIEEFCKKPIPFGDQVAALLELEMCDDFNKDADAVEKVIPEFKMLRDKIRLSLKDPEAFFDEKILLTFMKLSIDKRSEDVSKELDRCMHFYISYFAGNEDN